ncbi:N-acetyltransferase 9-like protein [Mizuhopecten yessoensis]|uniref:N-acetyltransferase 9-like protein n=1 Tax=Mizuhopecten yessoensis TaxID=6573 RepID=A0A210PM02_MIZYE|nr:N-acetyltransferase 9-like protein [Mizuhopecten yessoensis]OWF37494.1 N-acetyltransferase 9-like protein [Mizuhopecten yessoensis]
MLINANTVVKSEKIILVPYENHHVPRYHQWMQSKELQQLTASEPLSLEEEYQMQQSWRQDEDKCTFIILDLAIYSPSGKDEDEISAMVGDVNLFFNDEDNKHSAEIEIMIAEPSARRKGFGKETLLCMMQYGVQTLKVQEFTAKIGFSNVASIQLFHKLGFKEVSRSEVFEEVTLKHSVAEQASTPQTGLPVFQIGPYRLKSS